MASSRLSYRWRPHGFAALPALAAMILAGCTSSATSQRFKSLEEQVLLLQNRADRLEERVSGLEWAARAPQRNQAATQEVEQPDLPVIRLEPGADEPPNRGPTSSASATGEPGGSESGVEAPQAAPQSGNATPGGAKKSGEKAGVPAKETPEDEEAPHTRIEIHAPSSELRIPHGSIHRLTGCRLCRVGDAVLDEWSEEEAACDAV